MTEWFKDAIIYGIDVKVFFDSNGDGIGDFPGLTSKLPYLADLGFNCLWLLPFYPSPLRDNGYDVSDFYNVDPRLGTLEDFKAFVAEAKRLQFRLIVDLVANHSSDQHPWFQSARRDPQSPYRDYYIWVDQPPPNTGNTPIFPTVEESNWRYDETAKAYYWHYFYRFQPDLNHLNPSVQEEFRRVMAFWLELGVDGFRIDAAPFVIAHKGTEKPRENPRHDILREMRAYAENINPEVVLLGEANTEPERLGEYFGQGDELNMLFNFLLDSYLFLVLAREEAEELREFLQKLPPKPENAQWLNFLRNHDELSLERLTEAEREEVYKVFAPEEHMRVYNRGIRRRLAPMLKGDRRHLELAFSLLFSLPGAPAVLYGDEIGMGDDLSLHERDAVRTPMQWSTLPNGGFSAAPSEKLLRPVISQGDFSYKHVNVEAQLSDPEAIVHWVKRLIECYKTLPELSHGQLHLIRADDTAVMVHACTWEGKTTIALHNLNEHPCRVHCHFDGYDITQFDDAFDDQPYAHVGGAEIELHPYGYRWLVSRR
jgi:maltose alpha-D-glucosyltransferase / alpha-amylase